MQWPVKHLALILLACAASRAQQAQPPSSTPDSGGSPTINPGRENPDALFRAFNLPDQEFSIPRYCESISKGMQQAAALSQLCQFALSLGDRMPNVICSQETKRYKQAGLLGKGEMKLEDVVTAQVSYEGGKERYRDMAVNGKAIHGSTPNLRAAWSTGEFASALLDIFSPRSEATFRFVNLDTLHSIPALVFDYEVAPENNELWHVEVGDIEVFPGYSGRIWINQTSLHLMRLERGNIKVDPRWPIQEVDSSIDYADVQLGDGTSFTLPTASETDACRQPHHPPCWRSTLTFKNWHKFTAKSRIVPEGETPQ